jgi:hypothetical protein
MNKKLTSSTARALFSTKPLTYTPVRYFTFNRLTAHYPQRKAMKYVLEELDKRTRYQILPFSTKCIQFWTLKKRRFFYLFLLYLVHRYYERFTKWVAMRK